MDKDKNGKYPDGGSDSNQLLDEALVLASEIEQLVVRVLLQLEVTQDANIEQYLSAMAVRCLNFFRASLLLSRESLAQPAATCVRSLIEQRWVFGAVASEDTREEAIQRLSKHDEYSRKGTLDKLHKVGIDKRDQRITDEAISEIREGLGTGKKYYVTSWAELAKCNDEYSITYTRLCDLSHSTASAIESHLLFDLAGNVRSVTANPDNHSLLLCLTQACHTMIDVIAVSPESWRTEKVVADAIKLKRRTDELLESIPDQFPPDERNSNEVYEAKSAGIYSGKLESYVNKE